jgi:hypothetical protein
MEKETGMRKLPRRYRRATSWGKPIGLSERIGPRPTVPLALIALVVGLVVLTGGCTNEPLGASRSTLESPAPLREPLAETEGCGSYEDSLTGGQIFTMYCSYCHNAPSLAERPYSQFRNVAAHMRVRANLTGKEYEKLMAFLRRWHDVPPPGQPDPPSPKRFIYSQPISELQPPAATPVPTPPGAQLPPPAPAPAKP